MTIICLTHGAECEVTCFNTLKILGGNVFILTKSFDNSTSFAFYLGDVSYEHFYFPTEYVRGLIVRDNAHIALFHTVRFPKPRSLDDRSSCQMFGVLKSLKLH